MSQLIALAVKEELERQTGGFSIKWPNDIYWEEKKICGLLIENELSAGGIGRSIAGIGVNINQEVFRSDAPNPVSLKQITGQDYDRTELLADILTRVNTYYNRLRTEEPEAFSHAISVRYGEALFRREGWHPYVDAQGIFQARIVRIEQDGRLVLEDAEGKLRGYLFKEVQYVL